MRAATWAGLAAAGLVIAGLAGGPALRRAWTAARSNSAATTPPTVDLAGTACATLDAAGVARPSGALPDDPELAAFTERIERAGDEVLALNAIRVSTKAHPPDAATAACTRRLWATIAGALPEQSILRHHAAQVTKSILAPLDPPPDAEREQDRGRARAAGPPPGDVHARLRRVDEEYSSDYESRGLTGLFRQFPDNARLRRALLLHFVPYREDNYDWIEGDNDSVEPMMRLTLSCWPERLGVTFAFLADAYDAGPALGRIPLDLGATGNALRVVRDLVTQSPDARTALASVARAHAGPEPVGRPTRWLGLAAYLEAGAPDPGSPPEPAIASALRGDAASRRWALAWLPSERSKPWHLDPRERSLIDALAAAAGAVEGDDDVVLSLGALAGAPPGTALDVAVRRASSPNDVVYYQWLATMRAQIGSLPPPRDPRRLFAAHLDALRDALHTQLCTGVGASTLLADVGDRTLDLRLSACIDASPAVSASAVRELFDVCRDRRPPGWRLTAAALERRAADGESGSYTRRGAQACRWGDL